jgi:hypothetical protein
VVPISFKSRIKGAGAGVTYTSSVKPPLHPVFQAGGWRGQFTAAVATQLVAAGGAASATLGASFSATARALIGMMLTITAGVGVGSSPLVVEYTAGKVATLGDSFNPVLDGTTSVALPANWTYAQTSPNSASARTTDHPTGTCYIYLDGVLWKFGGVRGTLTLDGQTARPGYATFNGTGVFLGRSDAPIPADLAVAGHSAPVLVQGAGVSPAVLVNRKPATISTWSLDPGSQLEDIVDPNTPNGFGASQITARVPTLKIDPYATLVANRDTISDIGSGVMAPIVVRHGSVAGNRWSLTVPLAQPINTADGSRGQLQSEEITFQCRGNGADAVTRDVDRILCFS